MEFDKSSAFISVHLLSPSSPIIEVYLNPLSNPLSTTFTATTSPGVHHRYHTRVHRSIHRGGQGTRVLSTLKERERRGREFLDPFSIVTRLMGEGSPVRVFEPVISPTLDSAGKTRPAAGRGTKERTNGDPLSARPSPRVQATCIIRQIWSRQNGLKKNVDGRQKARKPEGLA